jgi:hypothetical protein
VEGPGRHSDLEGALEQTDDGVHLPPNAEVAWHTNLTENRVRQGVLYRKIGGGCQPWKGAWILERLMSVHRTSRIRGVKFVEVMRDALRGKGYPAFGAPSG